MTAYQERKLSMFMVVYQYIFDTDPDLLAKMPNFVALYDLFTTQVNTINGLTGNQTLNRSGIVINKTTAREVMCKEGALLAGKVMGFASNTNNSVLFEEVNYPESILLKMADTLCLASCSIIRDRVNDNLAALASYGISSDRINAYEVMIEEFELCIPKPQSGIVSKKQATSMLEVAFKEATDLLQKMFVLTKIVKDEEPIFYIDFVNSKRITKPAYRVLSASGRVVDSNGVPIRKVTMYCSDLKFGKRTSKNGGFRLSAMPDGVYSFEFSRAGYVSKKVDLVFYSGVRFEIVVELDLVEN